jgi:hypothetical protein
LNAVKYINGTKSQFAFVSTNSICQGEQVAILWPLVFSEDIQISFAHTSFKWTNNAKSNAGVVCIVVGMESNLCKRDKKIYTENHVLNVKM